MEAQLNIALFWYESILYLKEPFLVWNDVVLALHIKGLGFSE